MSTKLPASKRLAGLLANEFADTVASGSVVVALPRSPYVLRGLVVGRTSTKDVFEIWWIALPLCAPMRQIVLNYGDRIGSPHLDDGGLVEFSSRTVNAEQIRQLARRLDESLREARIIATPRDWCARWPADKPNIYAKDTPRAVMLALAGRDAEARAVLRRIAALPRDRDQAIEAAIEESRQFARQALVALDDGAETFRRLTGQIEQANYDRLFPGLRPAVPSGHA